jgi:hypothetical protein
MTQFLRQPCFMRFPESQLPAFLAPEETFALKAYLRSCALIGQPAEPNRGTGAQPPMVAKPIDSPTAGTPPAATGTTDAKPANAGKRVAWVPNTAGTPPGGHHRVTLQTSFCSSCSRTSRSRSRLGLGLAALARQGPGDRLAVTPRGGFRGSHGASDRDHRGRAPACVLVPARSAWDAAPLQRACSGHRSCSRRRADRRGQVMLRHIRRSVAAAPRPIPELADYALLTLLLVATVSGLSMAVRYRWGSSWRSAR